MTNAIIVTGGAGFIGSNFIVSWLAAEADAIINVDKLTYAGNLSNLKLVTEDKRHTFVRGDIADRALWRTLFSTYRPRAIVNFAAESHVDRSIVGADEFIQTNVIGTFHLLDEALAYWKSLEPGVRNRFRVLHVSTDEVYGSLGPSDAPFTEHTPFAPNSPYAASKAASDHLCRAYCHTHGLPVLVTNCSNNYGQYQFPEKLIPLMILNGLQGKSLPLYGDGQNVRDWLYVSDHCEAIRLVLRAGRPGDAYNIGGNCEKTNMEIVETVCGVLDEVDRNRMRVPHSRLITLVTDRPGHDRRYAIDATKIRTELGWEPKESFDTGIRKTIAWYMAAPDWVADVCTGAYREWIKAQYTTAG